MLAWIKVDSQTARKSEVVRLARHLNVNRHEALGLCVAFWGWADGESDDGYLPGCTTEMIDEIMGHPGFAKALQKVGWLVGDKEGLFIPNFDRHNGESAKKRALATRRKDRWRSRNRNTR